MGPDALWPVRRLSSARLPAPSPRLVPRFGPLQAPLQVVQGGPEGGVVRGQNPQLPSFRASETIRTEAKAPVEGKRWGIYVTYTCILWKLKAPVNITCLHVSDLKHMFGVTTANTPNTKDVR